MTQSWQLVAALAAVFVGLTGAVLSAMPRPQRRGVSRSLAAVGAISADAHSARAPGRPTWDRAVATTRGWLARLGHRLSSVRGTGRLRHRLDLAGNPAGWDVDRVLAWKVVALLALGALGLVLLLPTGRVLAALIVAGAMAAAGLLLPDLLLHRTAANRSERIRRELPDALDLLVISVEAGLGFDAALSQVARNTTGPLADELVRVLQEMQLGTGRDVALRALAERSDVDDLRSFIASIVQAGGFGIPVADVLRVQAQEMRVKRAQRAEEHAQKIPVKMIFPLVFCIMPALFIVIIGPAVLQVLDAFDNL